jgi:alkanesulfonate monooxygenase SsuD/methylene tetrahydromethanopterin reductase-like flavin-dependent oxidoreductase (luciferase family)
MSSDPRPLAVALGWHQLAFEELVSLARHAEALGYAALYVDGDVSQIPSLGEGDVLDGWTVGTALAARTERIAIASIRLVHHWNAAHLAQATATFERISPGRQRVFLAAGGQPSDRRFGLPFPAARERIAWLDETLGAVRRLWRGEEVSLDGFFVQLDRARVRPIPLPPPLLEVAARGPRMLELVARHADAWNVNLPPLRERWQSAEEHLARACDAQGRDPSTIQRACWVFARPLHDPADPAVRQAFARFNPWFGDLSDSELDRAVLSGGAERCRARLDEWREELSLDLPVIELTGLGHDAARHALDALAPSKGAS